MENNNDDNRTGKNHAGRRANKPLKILTASSVCGDKVNNTEGQHIGKITDVMLNLDEGNIQYMVVEFGGFLSFKKKYFAIPFDEMTVDTEHRAFIVDRTLKSFQDDPGFDADHWPMTNSHYEHSRFDGGFMGPNTGSDHS